MKKFFLAFAVLMSVTLFYNTIEAQNIGINVNINIGRQPAWGPAGYNYVDYYYLPDINCYYNVNLGLFYFLNQGAWVSAQYLPPVFRNYNLYSMYKVVLNGVNNPWRYNNRDIRNYGQYRGVVNQVVIRDSRNMRYQNSRNNKVAGYSNQVYGRSNNNRTVYYGSSRSDSHRVSSYENRVPSYEIRQGNMHGGNHRSESSGHERGGHHRGR